MASASTASRRLTSARYGNSTPITASIARLAIPRRNETGPHRRMAMAEDVETPPHECIAAAAKIQKGNADPREVKLIWRLSSYASQPPNIAYAAFLRPPRQKANTNATRSQA